MRFLKNPAFYIAILVALDQATKLLVRQNFFPGESVRVAPFVYLTYVTNTGMAFSLFRGANTFFVVFSLAALVFFWAWYRKHGATLSGGTKVAVTLIAAGATGNLIDRLALGHVTDFIEIIVGAFHWPAFNVADSCISIGGGLLFFQFLRSHPPAPEPTKTER